MKGDCTAILPLDDSGDVGDDSQMKEDCARRLEDAGETPAFPGGNDSKKKFAPNKRPRDDRPVAPPMGE